MLNSLGAKSSIPWRIDENMLVPSGYLSIQSKLNNKKDIYHDSHKIFPEVKFVKNRGKSPPEKVVLDYDRLMNVPDHKEHFLSLMNATKRPKKPKQNLNKTDLGPGLEDDGEKSKILNLRLYPGITSNGIKRLMNNTFTRINNEQSQSRTQAARRRNLILKQLKEYDDPLKTVLYNKQIDLSSKDFHDIDNIPSTRDNERRVERLLKKLDKEVLSSTFLARKQIALLPKDISYSKLNRSKDESQQAAVSDEERSSSFFITGEKKVLPVKKLDLDKLKPFVKKRSNSALPAVKLSNMNIVEEPFTLRAVENFINQNSQTYKGDITSKSRLYDKTFDGKSRFYPLESVGMMKSYENSSQEVFDEVTGDNYAYNSRSDISQDDIKTHSSFMEEKESKFKVKDGKTALNNRLDSLQCMINEAIENNQMSIKHVECCQEWLRKDHDRLKNGAMSNEKQAFEDEKTDKILDSTLKKEMMLELERRKHEGSLEKKTRAELSYLHREKMRTMEGSRFSRRLVVKEDRSVRNVENKIARVMNNLNRTPHK